MEVVQDNRRNYTNYTTDGFEIGSDDGFGSIDYPSSPSEPSEDEDFSNSDEDSYIFDGIEQHEYLKEPNHYYEPNEELRGDWSPALVELIRNDTKMPIRIIYEKIDKLAHVQYVHLIEIMNKYPDLWPRNWPISKNEGIRADFRKRCMRIIKDINIKMESLEMNYPMFKATFGGRLCQNYHTEMSHNWKKGNYLCNHQESLTNMYDGYSFYERVQSEVFEIQEYQVIELIDTIYPKEDLWSVFSEPYTPKTATNLYKSIPKDVFDKLSFEVVPQNLEIIRMHIERHCNEQFFKNDKKWKNTAHYLYEYRHKLLKMFGIDHLD